ncbi:MAG: fatty acid--CoA ligase family protein [Acidimicrobiales bacterium]
MIEGTRVPGLVTLLRDHPAEPGEPLVHTITDSFTRADIQARVDSLAGQLGDLPPGAGVAVVADGDDALVAYFGVWQAGGVVVPVNSRRPEAAQADVVADADPAAVIRGTAIERRPSAMRHADEAAFVMWTSGTTGRPTPILHSHAGYLEIIDRVLGPLAVRRDRNREPSPNLIPVPLALNAGIYNALFGLRAGAPLVLMHRFDPHDFATLVRRHRIRSTVLPPAALTMLNAATEIDDLAPLRYVRSITAPLSPFQARRFQERFGVFVLNGYGQAELGEVIGWSAADAGVPRPPGSGGPAARRGVGPPRIARRQRRGELLVRPPREPAPGVRAALGDRIGPDGHVRTGDLGRIDDEGFVWIEGRTGDLINRGGNKVFPDEVEEVLAAVPGVDDVAVAGRPDDRLGEVPVAYVVEAVADDELEAACRRHLAPYKVPVRFERIDAVPRSEVGKPLRRQLPS